MSYNIALISPNENAYSETFIQAHRNLIKGKIYFLYGGYFPGYYQDENGKEKSLRKIGGVEWRKLLPIFVYNRIGEANIESNYLSKFLKDNKIDVVLAEYGITGAKVLATCQRLKIPLLVHFHGFDAHSKGSVEVYSADYKKMFAFAQTIFSVSNFMTESLIKMGASSDKIVYNPYGPNKDFLKLSPNYESPYFLAVGRFTNKKAPYFTLLAFKKVVERFPDAKLKFVGDGKILEVCKNIADYLALPVKFLGIQNSGEVKTLMSNSFCFVQHSIVTEKGDAEGTPVAILEAQAAALPVVSTKHAGINEAVIDGKSGFLVDEKDVDAMADAMIKLYADRQLAEQMGQKGREHVSKNYTMEQHIGKIDTQIEKAILASRNKK